MAPKARAGWTDHARGDASPTVTNRGGEASGGKRKRGASKPSRIAAKSTGGGKRGIFKNAAVGVLRETRRLMSTGDITKHAISRGFLDQLPGKTPEATMASTLYTDIKRWKAGIPGCVFCRPQEGLFGLREWSEDTQLKDLVAGEQDDPFFRPGHIGSVRRVVDQPYPYGYGNGPRHFGHNFAAAKARAEGSGKGKHSNHPLLQRAWSDESSQSFQGGMVGGYGGNYNSGKQSKKTGIKDDTDDDENEGLEGLGLLLDAASGMGNSDKKKEHPMARYNQQQAKKATSSRPAHQPGPITGSAAIPSLTVTQSQLLLQQARRNLLNSSSRDNGNANNNGNAVTEEKLATAIQEEKQIQLDRVVTALSAQCAELYIMLGPHEVVARELATLIVTLRSGGGKYQAQEKVVTGQLWELVRAMTFPQGMGDTQETQGALARVVASMIDNAAVTAAASLVEVSAAAEIKVRLGMASERD